MDGRSDVRLAPGAGLGARQGSRLWYSQPSSSWLQGLPIGNGRLGAMVWGGPQRKRADLNVDTLWSRGPRTAHPRGVLRGAGGAAGRRA
jgi:alpha-L-fucosidase 2